MIHVRAKILGVLTAVLILGTLVAVPVAAIAEGGTSGASVLAEESCPSGNVCAWPSRNFQGNRGDTLCIGGTHPLAGTKESVKNRCANKGAILRKNGVEVWCIGPSENANTPPFNEVTILAEGGRC